jgi:hypothetical protein
MATCGHTVHANMVKVQMWPEATFCRNSINRVADFNGAPFQLGGPDPLSSL